MNKRKTFLKRKIQLKGVAVSFPLLIPTFTDEWETLLFETSSHASIFTIRSDIVLLISQSATNYPYTTSCFHYARNIAKNKMQQVNTFSKLASYLKLRASKQADNRSQNKGSMIYYTESFGRFRNVQCSSYINSFY